jgi:Skp family chaperone for outer membrane proteins
MKMKLYLVILVLATSFTFAQGNQEKREKIKALKVAFLTEKLALSSEEAQKFWPIYNAFEEKQFEIRYKKLKGLGNQLKDNSEEKILDKEALQLIAQFESYEDELHGLKKKFIKDLLVVLSPKKVILLKKYEDEFNRKLLRQMREGRN